METVRDFHRLYYGEQDRTWRKTFWLGMHVMKCPLDLWIYQEILFRTQPDLIIESGTFGGGSAHYLASICDLLGQGHVVTIDVEVLGRRPAHPRITYLTGSSVDPKIVQAVESSAKGKDKVMVILDSDHHRNHVLQELRTYGPLVTKDQYLILEDTNVNGHPVEPGHGPGPMEALEDFLAEDDSFVVDRSCEKFFLTFNPSGYLKRVR